VTKIDFDTFYNEIVDLVEDVIDTDMNDIVTAYDSPAEKIVTLLVSMKNKYLEEDPDMVHELNYAIQKINNR